MLYECFKARYFPRSTFLEATNVPNNSYVWKSLIATQPIFQKGCCWRVGNGVSIRMVKDRWIPNYPTNKVLHPPLDEEWEWRVANIIDWSTHDWNKELIAANFHRDDMEAILRIPLSRR